jgi:hypothetical protein
MLLNNGKALPGITIGMNPLNPSSDDVRTQRYMLTNAV